MPKKKNKQSSNESNNKNVITPAKKVDLANATPGKPQKHDNVTPVAKKNDDLGKKPQTKEIQKNTPKNEPKNLFVNSKKKGRNEAQNRAGQPSNGKAGVQATPKGKGAKGQSKKVSNAGGNKESDDSEEFDNEGMNLSEKDFF